MSGPRAYPVLPLFLTNPRTGAASIVLLPEDRLVLASPRACRHLVVTLTVACQWNQGQSQKGLEELPTAAEPAGEKVLSRPPPCSSRLGENVNVRQGKVLSDAFFVFFAEIAYSPGFFAKQKVGVDQNYHRCTFSMPNHQRIPPNMEVLINSSKAVLKGTVSQGLGGNTTSSTST